MKKFPNSEIEKVYVGNHIEIMYHPIKEWVRIFHHDKFLKQVSFENDATEKKIVIVEITEMGADVTKLANALHISRQSIYNYMNIKTHFGSEGLIHGYSPKTNKTKQQHRQEHRDKRHSGGITQQLAATLQEQRQEQKQKQTNVFDIPDALRQPVDAKTQPFSQTHDWQFSRYAGIFTYLIALISRWHWLELIQGYFGVDFKIFFIFLLMSAHKIGSIEQLKNVRKHEAGFILGLGKIASRPKVWADFYQVARQKLSEKLKHSFFKYQIKLGLVGLWLWFSDGHLLPYEGKEKVHYSFNTQRQKPYPGQTNWVTSDNNGNIVDFEIQEGKGDVHQYIKMIVQRWADDLPVKPVQVFDRENYGAERFIEYTQLQIPFVCWDKHADTNQIKALVTESFTDEFTFNDKIYRYIESEKLFKAPVSEKNKPAESVLLRHFAIWNVSSNRYTSCLACPKSVLELDATECVKAILSRWGASENMFKHIQSRHPLHYHPGFGFKLSENQLIANPAIKEIDKQIQAANRHLTKFCKELSQADTTHSGRQNSAFDRIKREIAELQSQIQALKQQKSTLPEKVDVTTLENYRSFQKIDNEGKNLFDFVTASVWNARNAMVDWLREYYDCKNDIVDLFYAITYCHGWVQCTDKEIIVRLEPLQQPKRRAAQEQFCRKLTGLAAKISNRKKMIIEVGESPFSPQI
jgi:hypothetical protein